MNHLEHLDAIKQITVDQIQAFSGIAEVMHERGRIQPEIFTEVWQRTVCEQLGLNYDHWRYYNELANFMTLGMVPYMPVLQIAVTAFVGADVRETLDRFSRYDKELIVSAYEVGNEWVLDNHRLVCTCRAIDSLVSLYSTHKLEIDEQEENRCVAYPGMPNMPHQFVEMYKLIDEARLIVSGRWRTPLRYFHSRERDYIWNYPPTMSTKGNVIIQTDAGTIYLNGAPKRGDTNANHLRSV
ncbi:hypothetical protein pEaSNUABM3_00284 [Erwinia phage pEa_SNUABM_3]|uniref:Uncharacterized protein n=1 Tax=Erwinia phage pEa_SNUABM_3 TaxID=2869552 RepID=A0AAE7XHJ3_9CAUD|nr:hypothetical protein MPK68_gp284 [Erwinia phage pEa_SNUABM_3]QZE56481.1 hypothetical protein pEaSNUABM3_00284 [Erwinia phage pEa_SNUABM_3]